jgi:hypothetical protein
MKLVFQSVVLIISFIVIFLWQITLLSQYTVPLLGLLIGLYLIVSSRKGGKGFLTMGGEGPWGIFILNTLIFLLIFSTGSLNSPLFFLLYFLGFGIAFVFEPSITFVLVIGTVLVFLPDIAKNDLMNNLLKMGSLALISPLAYFFGKEYRRNDAQEESIEALKERTKDAADTISQDLEQVIKQEKQSLNEKDLNKLNEILEETEDLRQESKV